MNALHHDVLSKQVERFSIQLLEFWKNVQADHQLNEQERSRISCRSGKVIDELNRLTNEIHDCYRHL